MTNPPRPKSHTSAPTRPRPAEPADPTTGPSAPKNAARQGAPSSLRSGLHASDGRYAMAWLHITAPRGAVPTATSKCECGWDRSAVGRHKVLALIEDHTAHRTQCPLRTNTDRKNAA
jgi:hypothetical protein